MRALKAVVGGGESRHKKNGARRWQVHEPHHLTGITQSAGGICVRNASRGKGLQLCAGKKSSAYLQPQVVLSFVGHFTLVVGDVASADDTVHGPLIGVCVVPEGPAVMQPELALGSWGQSKDTRGQTDTRFTKILRASESTRVPMT